MKGIYLLILLVAGFSVLSSSSASGQRRCKVLMKTINQSYKGKCKKGLAHGKNGYAKGIDKYKGAFRTGLPHGSGTYTYSTGEVYVGRWKEGMKHGDGRYTFKIDDKDTTTVGIWENDVYIGPKPEAPYKIKYMRGIDRHKVVRTSDGERVMIEFMRNGSRNDYFEQFRIFGSTGIELNTPIARGFDVVTFPFECRITYFTWNKMRTSKVEVIFDFVINEPGDWLITLHN
jgi:hypothetical protein